MKELPIDSVIPELRQTLVTRHNIVLVAPPGAGKTTRVPLALLHETWLSGRKIVMLEPRRLAARSVARYMAASLGENIAETVGYRVRMDTKVGRSTRIEVVTEGVLTRMLQTDPALEETGMVIFDEFHERSLHADLGLALCLQSQALLREDLRIMVMSATLDAAQVSGILGDAPIVISEGRAFPVETRYLSGRADGGIENAIVRTITDAVERECGNILVFLPGVGEIRRVEARLAQTGLGPRIMVTPLHGTMPQEAQERAIAPAPPDWRKIVLATSIAETSLTVEGVRIVIDSGLMRVPRFSPRTGMTRLETVPVSLSAADQRRGRAGRLEPGICYRLWTEHEHRSLAPQGTPEIAEADLAALVLELALWGVTDPSQLQWLDPPSDASFGQARGLLIQLGALESAGKATPHGRRLAELGAHPRLGHMMVTATGIGLGELACELAAILSERDFLRGDSGLPDADLRLRIAALHGQSAPDLPEYALSGGSSRADMSAIRRIMEAAKLWKREIGLRSEGTPLLDKCGLVLAFAYPDRIVQKKGNGKFVLSGGRGAVLASNTDQIGISAYMVAAELDELGGESRIFLAAPVEEAELRTHLADLIIEQSIVEWDSEAQAVRARKQERLGALILKETMDPQAHPDDVSSALLAGIAAEGLDLLPWTKSARQLQQRIVFMNRHDPRWPDASEDALTAKLAEWLLPHVGGMRNRGDLQRLQLHAILEAMLDWEERRQLDQSAPTHIVAPSGSRIPIDYSDPEQPVMAVKLQEMFGLQAPPRIAGGKVPLTLHLLSPAQRPVQVTQDLTSFWHNTYFDVKKDLRGRYPKHYWPDDPLAAIPTNRTRPNGAYRP